MLSKDKDIQTEEYNKNKVRDISIRQAGYEDIDALVEICKKNFTDIIVWQIPLYFLRKRWEFILSSDAAETWICTVDGKTVGLATLIFDAATYKQKVRHFNGGLLKKMCFYLMCPRLSFLKSLKKIHIIASEDNKNKSIIKNETIPAKCTWIEPLAVLPDMHRKGIATKLLEHCKSRTIQLKMSGIKLLVRPNNTAATRLYVKHGFICSDYNTHTDTYILILKEKTTDEIKKH